MRFLCGTGLGWLWGYRVGLGRPNNQQPKQTTPLNHHLVERKPSGVQQAAVQRERKILTLLLSPPTVQECSTMSGGGWWVVGFRLRFVFRFALLVISSLPMMTRSLLHRQDTTTTNKNKQQRKRKITTLNATSSYAMIRGHVTTYE